VDSGVKPWLQSYRSSRRLSDVKTKEQCGCLMQIRRRLFGYVPVIETGTSRRISVSRQKTIAAFEGLVKFLREVPLLANDFPSDDLPHLAMALRERNYQPGDVIVSQGAFPDDKDAFFIVYEGEVSLMWQADVKSDTAKEKRGTLRRGDYFGGKTLLENRPYTTSSIASAKGATVLMLSRQQFTDLGLQKLKFPTRGAVYAHNGGAPFIFSRTQQVGTYQNMDPEEFKFVAKRLCRNVHLRALYTEDVIERVAEKARRVEVAGGTTLYREGDPCNEFYIVASGSVSMRRDQNYRNADADDANALGSVKRRLRKQAFLEKMLELECEDVTLKKKTQDSAGLGSEHCSDGDDDSPLPHIASSRFVSCPSPANPLSQESALGHRFRRMRSRSLCLEDVLTFKVGDAVILNGEDPSRMRNVGHVVRLLPNEKVVVDFTLKGASVHKAIELRLAPTAAAKPALGTGAILGELSLLYNLPRLATCIASEESTVILYEIRRNDFRDVLFSLGARHRESDKVNEWAALLGEVRVLSSLVTAEIMELARMVDGEVTFSPHERVIKKGKVRELRQWYVIAGGTAVISRDDSKPVVVLGRGAYFGERSLLCGGGISEVNVDAGEGGLLCVCINGRILENLAHCFETDGTVDDYEHSKGLASKPKATFHGNIHALRKESVLGHGNFGTVFLAVDDVTQEQFALKRVSKRRVRQTKAEEPTRNERDLMSMVHSPFIIKLFCSYQDSDYVYMLQEAALGGTLETLNEKFHAQHLANDTRAWFSATQYFVGCVAMGLRHLHGRHIVHRDLKLGNILLCQDGSPKICDFGFARFVLDKTFTVLGTPEYMAPEIIEFPHAHDEMVDYWALGVFTYELLSGTVPWEDTSEEGRHLVYRIRQLQKSTPFPRIKGDVPAAVSDFVHSLLATDPNLRLGKRGSSEVRNHKWFRHDFFDFEGLEKGTMKLPQIPLELPDPDELPRVTPSMVYPFEEDEMFRELETHEWEYDNMAAEDGRMEAQASQGFGFQTGSSSAKTKSSQISRITINWNPSECRGPVYVGLTSEPNDDRTFKNGCCVCISPGLSNPQLSSSPRPLFCYQICSQDFDSVPITLAVEQGSIAVYVNEGSDEIKMEKVHSMKLPNRMGMSLGDDAPIYGKVFMNGSGDSLTVCAYEEYPDDGSNWHKDFKTAGQLGKFAGSTHSVGSLYSPYASECNPTGPSASPATPYRDIGSDKDWEVVEDKEPEMIGTDVSSLLGLLAAIEKDNGQIDLKRAIKAACVAVNHIRPHQALAKQGDASLLDDGVRVFLSARQRPVVDAHVQTLSVSQTPALDVHVQTQVVSRDDRSTQTLLMTGAKADEGFGPQTLIQDTKIAPVAVNEEVPWIEEMVSDIDVAFEKDDDLKPISGTGGTLELLEAHTQVENVVLQDKASAEASVAERFQKVFDPVPRKIHVVRKPVSTEVSLAVSKALSETCKFPANHCKPSPLVARASTPNSYVQRAQSFPDSYAHKIPNSPRRIAHIRTSSMSSCSLERSTSAKPCSYLGSLRRIDAARQPMSGTRRENVIDVLPSRERALTFPGSCVQRMHSSPTRLETKRSSSKQHSDLGSLRSRHPVSSIRLENVPDGLSSMAKGHLKLPIPHYVGPSAAISAYSASTVAFNAPREAPFQM